MNDEDDNAADIEDGDLIETEAQGEEYQEQTKVIIKKSNMSRGNN